MADVPTLPLPGDKPSDQEMAAALDTALDALQAGRPFDRDALLARHPALASALGALDQLFSPTGPPMAPAPALARPQFIGPYRIERDLGAGGFGVVYLAYDPDVRRRVAIKVLHPGRLDQPECLLRFQREAHAIGRLHHSGIVQLFEYSREGPPYFLVTEYVEGVEPRAWCQQHGCTPARIADLVARIADAVEYAHQQGVCHRDLKPGNILVDADGAPHILDFGLARLEASDGVTVTAQTLEGHILGSLQYMPPEQATGQSHTADARSDVYSMGVILYELLTGQLPYSGPAHTLPARLMEETPTPPRRLVPDLPADLEAVCLKAMARRPGDRYPTAAALATDLRAFVAGEPVRARPLSWPRQILRMLDRRHLDTLRQGWTLLLLLLGVTILAGCVLCNRWELTLPPERVWVALLLTKAGQVALMLLLVVRLRPRPATQGAAVNDRPVPVWNFGALTAAERQIWSLVPGYYGSLLTLVAINYFRSEPIPLAPVLALLSGMSFATLGATIWGWFYVWAAGFLLLALLIALCAPYGMTLLGLGWFVCLVVGSIHLYCTG